MSKIPELKLGDDTAHDSSVARAACAAGAFTEETGVASSVSAAASTTSKKYKHVIILGPDIPEIPEDFTRTANVLIIGDGKRDVSVDEITRLLSGRLDSGSIIDICAHGILGHQLAEGGFTFEYDSSEHTHYTILKEDIESSEDLTTTEEIYKILSESSDGALMLRNFSCFGGKSVNVSHHLPTGSMMCAYSSENYSRSDSSKGRNQDFDDISIFYSSFDLNLFFKNIDNKTDGFGVSYIEESGSHESSIIFKSKPAYHFSSLAEYYENLGRGFIALVSAIPETDSLVPLDKKSMEEKLISASTGYFDRAQEIYHHNYDSLKGFLEESAIIGELDPAYKIILQDQISSYIDNLEYSKTEEELEQSDISENIKFINFVLENFKGDFKQLLSNCDFYKKITTFEQFKKIITDTKFGEFLEILFNLYDENLNNFRFAKAYDKEFGTDFVRELFASELSEHKVSEIVNLIIKDFLESSSIGEDEKDFLRLVAENNPEEFTKALQCIDLSLFQSSENFINFAKELNKEEAIKDILPIILLSSNTLNNFRFAKAYDKEFGTDFVRELFASELSEHKVSEIVNLIIKDFLESNSIGEDEKDFLRLVAENNPEEFTKALQCIDLSLFESSEKILLFLEQWGLIELENEFFNISRIFDFLGTTKLIDSAELLLALDKHLGKGNILTRKADYYGDQYSLSDIMRKKLADHAEFRAKLDEYLSVEAASSTEEEAVATMLDDVELTGASSAI